MLLFRKISLLFLIIFFVAFCAVPVSAVVQPEQYGLPVISDSVNRLVTVKTVHLKDSLFWKNAFVKDRQTVVAISSAKPFIDKTIDFYLLLVLFILLGLIRISDPRYFQGVWHAFKNPGSSSRQLQEKLQHASISNLLMNSFFALSAATYTYYVVRRITPGDAAFTTPSLLILMLIGGMIAVYIGKYAVIKISGWAFRAQGLTEHYLFNVFLVNIVVAMVLLPFIVVLAFAAPVIAEPALIVSLVLILILFINRYMRSWQVFGSFFQYSKFHFFTYLCASELLPLAVLMKLLVRGLLH